jgi:NTE family protein
LRRHRGIRNDYSFDEQGGGLVKAETPFAWLRAVDAFKGLGDPELRRLLARCFTQTLARGDALVEAGHPADALHILMSGRLAIREKDMLREAGPGLVIGSPEFFARRVYRSSFAAARDSLILTLEWEEFTQLADRAPEYWQAAAVSFAQMAKTEAQAPRRAVPRTLAIVPAGKAPLDAGLVNRIANALDGFAECQVLRASSFGQNMPGGISLDDPDVARWLQEQQQAFDLIIRIGDGEDNDWTRAAIAEADEILMLADGAARGEQPLNAAEAMAFELRGPQACRLVLVSDRPAEATARIWLPRRKGCAHHHLRAGDDESAQRLARLVLGRGGGYVACNGAHFAIAHLGIVEALVPIDAVGGVGAGAIAAALIATQASPETAAAFFPPPRSRTEFERLLAAAFSLDIEDAAIPFRALSADVSSGAQVVHARGPIAEALLANWPPPGVAAPFIAADGSHLVDGALIDPMPAWLLDDLGVTASLGVVKPPLAPRESGRDWSLKRITGARDGESDLNQFFMRAMTMRRPADEPRGLVIAPQFAPGEYTQDAIRQAAYHFTIEQLQKNADGDGEL